METMLYKAMKHAIDLGNVDRAVIFRDPASGRYELMISFLRTEPRVHSRTFWLASQRGDVRRFKTIDSAYKVANELGLDEVRVIRDPVAEYRYEQGIIDERDSMRDA